ncbi:uncharacterized protein [Dermacentor andersoni]|uniref:uncharacterized protein n=1 Tax=Dermacentor andersoni TaxID=34620 RepID=UPI003B3B7391
MAPSNASVCTRRKQSTSIYCCVCGCHNSYKNTAGKLPKVQFYHFPWKSYEADRRQRWIAAVRRTRPNGDLWQPVQRRTVICSAHFVGNKASTIAGHPAYVPTVFPPCYKRSDAVLPASKLDRYKRVQRRRAVLQAPTSKSAITATAENSSTDFADEIIALPEETGTSASVMTQTDADFNGGVCTLFLSVTAEGAASTQVCHTSIVEKGVQASASVRSTAIGPNERSCAFLGYNSLIQRKDAFRELCGVSANVFSLLLSVLSPIVVREMDAPIFQKLSIFLMKMKLGVSFASIALLFGLHRTTVSRIFYFVLTNLLNAMQKWIPEPSLGAVQATMPTCFKLHFPRCRYIIDCTELRTEEPPTTEQKRALFSHYKGGYTLKFLIGILPNGTVTFVSQAYGGRASDTHITLESGFLDRIEPGDVILADKGFPGIKAPTESQKGIIVLPPFSKGNVQFTHEELEQTYHVAQVRIHVERAIQRLKMFGIVNSRVPIDLIPHMSDIMRMCCILANLQPPIIEPSNPDTELV